MDLADFYTSDFLSQRINRIFQLLLIGKILQRMEIRAGNSTETLQSHGTSGKLTQLHAADVAPRVP